MPVRFNLKRRSCGGRQEPTSLLVVVNRRGRQLKVASGVMIRPGDWSPSRGRLRPSVPGATAINGELEELHAVCQALILRHPDDERLRIAILEAVGRDRRQDAVPIAEHFDSFLTQKRLRNRPGSIQVYEGLKGHLVSYTGRNATLAGVGSAFVEDFMAHLSARGLENSTVNKLRRRLIEFLSWLESHGRIETVPKAKPLRTSRKPVVALTEDDVRAIASADLAALPRGYRAARDLFLMGVFTGARYSDLSKMVWDEIDLKRRLWTFAETKTAPVRRVPLVGWAAHHLQTRRGAKRPLDRVSNQKGNDYLKEIGRLLGLDRPVTQIRHQGAERIQSSRPLHELLSFHVGRRTHITLFLAGTGRTADLLGRTHDDLRSMARYVGADDEGYRRHLGAAFEDLTHARGDDG